MLIYKTGDILKADENIICHQVNVDGVMGGGLAKQIASAYPKVEKEYKRACNSFENNFERLRGLSKNVKINNDQYISNCFTQKPNFDTDYKAIKKCFKVLLVMCNQFNKTIAIPYKYGCGIANGDWNIVSKIFEDLSDEYGVNISIYKLKEEE